MEGKRGTCTALCPSLASKEKHGGGGTPCIN